MDSPYILDETDSFAVVFKPPKMHCVSNTDKENNGTLYKWFTENAATVFNIMHRLDYETNGLVLFAKNEKSYNYFKTAQDSGGFIKEYSAICIHIDKSKFINTSQLTSRSLSGFPQCPQYEDSANHFPSFKKKLPFIIESYFRPYGPGRKLVRPVTNDKNKHKEIAKDKGGFYKTEIIDIDDNVFTARIKRGFRHQIRCHLCWIGYPILNDPLYYYERDIDCADFNPGGSFRSESGFLALRSHALFFPDPLTGKQLEYRIPALAEDHSRLTAL